MYTPSKQLLKDVRAEFVCRGTSFSAYCESRGFTRQAVSMALSGARTGKKSLALGQEFLQSMDELE